MAAFVQSFYEEDVLRRALKRAAQVIVAGSAPITWRVRGRTLVVLMYHRVLPRGDERLLCEQPGMWVHPDTLAMHLRTLRSYFEIVRLTDWLERARNNEPLPLRACAITFDDGWRDNYDYAYPVLRSHDAPATIFVCSDLIGTDKRFWPERLATLLRLLSDTSRADDRQRLPWLRELAPALDSPRSSIVIEAIDNAIEAAKKRYSDESISRLLDEAMVTIGAQGNSRGNALLDWDQVREMLDSHIVDFGSHTRTHTRLSQDVGEQTLRDEIIESKHTIETHTGASVELFCYPNGDVAPAAYDMVKAAYRGACSTRCGWHSPADNSFMIRRIGVHEHIAFDPVSFLSRVSAWL